MLEKWLRGVTSHFTCTLLYQREIIKVQKYSLALTGVNISRAGSYRDLARIQVSLLDKSEQCMYGAYIRPLRIRCETRRLPLRPYVSA